MTRPIHAKALQVMVALCEKKLQPQDCKLEMERLGGSEFDCLIISPENNCKGWLEAITLSAGRIFLPSDNGISNINGLRWHANSERRFRPAFRTSLGRSAAQTKQSSVDFYIL